MSFHKAKGTINKMKRQPHKLGENICKWCNQWGLNLKNTQTPHTIQ